jgi:hypothetical protein
MSPISNTKDWGHDQIHGRIYLCHGSRFEHGLLPYKIGYGCPKDLYNLISLGKIKYKCLLMGIEIAPDDFQNVMSKLTQDMNQSSMLNRLSIWVTGLPKKVSNQCIMRWKPFLRIRLQKPGKNYWFCIILSHPRVLEGIGFIPDKRVPTIQSKLANSKLR